MPPPPPAAEPPSPSPVEEARRLWGVAERIDAESDPSGALDAFRGFLAFVETNRRALTNEAVEFAGRLDQATMAF